MRTHLAIFFADRGDVAVLKIPVVKSPNLMGWLYWRFAAINVENRRNGHTWRMPANLIADIWLTCQISAIFYADRGDRRKSQSLHQAHLAIFADRFDRRIKSPSVSLALATVSRHLGVLIQRHTWRFYTPIAAIGENRQVCPHQSVAKITCDIRWRSNSPRSTYKIARCVTGFRNDDGDGSENITIATNSRFSNVVAIIPTRFKCQMWVKFPGLGCSKSD